MPVVTGPDLIALQVRDLEAAAAFYRDVVGLPVAPSSPPNAVVFATTPIPFAVRSASVDLDLTEHLGHGMALWLRADDAVAVLDGPPITVSTSWVSSPTVPSGRPSPFVTRRAT